MTTASHCLLPIHGGQFALVDPDVFAWASAFRWYLLRGGYVMRTIRKTRTVYLHRAVTEAPQGTHVDHINHDKLDNRRENLRVVSPSQNGENRRGANRNSKTGVRGVMFRHGRYVAYVRAPHGRGSTHIGRFATLAEAEAAAKRARAESMPYASESVS